MHIYIGNKHFIYTNDVSDEDNSIVSVNYGLSNYYDHTEFESLEDTLGENFNWQFDVIEKLIKDGNKRK